MSSLVRRGLPASFTAAAGNPHAPVAGWLLGCSGIVAGIVHVGGVTRLTKSGLSMTDWKPLGSLPPRDDDEWTVEFDRYKTFPEWEQRRGMSLEEFKYIYYWEWGHRMLGRFVGVAFAVPCAYFAARRRIPPGYGPRMATLFAMGGAQGLVGWWMVRSGLGEDRRGDNREIRVSPYRLAAHLAMAFSTYSLLLWTGLDLLHHPNTSRVAAAGGGRAISDLAGSMSKGLIRSARRVRVGAIHATALTAVTVVSGAFVAGNDAGNAYNTFPRMGLDGSWIPWEDLIDPNLSPSYRNLFENTALVQLNHRILGLGTAASALTLAGVGLFNPACRAAFTPQVRRGLASMGTIALGQASLGVVTLVNYVPVGLAAAHQLGSLALLSSGIYLVHSLRYVAPSAIRSVATAATGAASKSRAVAASGAVRQLTGTAKTVT